MVIQVSFHQEMIAFANQVIVAGPLKPMPLTDGLMSRWGATNSECRLIYQASEFSIAHGLWVYQYRDTSDHDWQTVYSFVSRSSIVYLKQPERSNKISEESDAVLP